MNFIIELELLKGVMIGIRHFDPEEDAPYYEVQLFFLMLRVNLYFLPIEKEEEE
jgi:hypothetical protein|tara:strand:- start:79 stop:240 length:162 start_codon:yes stop_codon:yes gene_type:complete